jgi:hypothetical protein
MNEGVHETHCCIMHGCKYSINDDCPVVLDKIKQAYICEQCNDEFLKTVEEVRELFKSGKRKCECCGSIYQYDKPKLD